MRITQLSNATTAVATGPTNQYETKLPLPPGNTNSGAAPSWALSCCALAARQSIAVAAIADASCATTKLTSATTAATEPNNQYETKLP